MYINHAGKVTKYWYGRLLLLETKSEARVPEIESEARVRETESEARVPETESEAQVPETESEAQVPETESEARVPETESEATSTSCAKRGVGGGGWGGGKQIEAPGAGSTR